MIAVLYYHRVGPYRPDRPRKGTVLPENFRRQMEHLRARRSAVSLDDAASGRTPADAVAVTFDDGYAELLEHAVPVLREFRIPATIFVVTGVLGGTDEWHTRSERILDRDAVRALHGEGFLIGSHSRTHARLTDIAPEEARREVADSKRDLEDLLGAPVRHFAYPQGRASEETVRFVREAGYAAGWGTRSGWHPEFVRRRLRVPGSMKMLRFRWRLFKARFGWYG